MKTKVLMISCFLAGVLVACGGSGSADNGVTMADVQAAINAAVTPLQAQIATLQAQTTTLQAEIPHNLIVSRSGSAFGAKSLRILNAVPNAATLAMPTFTATFLGPPTGNIFGMTQQIGMSTSNYEFISQADGSVNSAGLPVTIFYEGLNCQGNAFTILAAGLSQANINQGVVFGTGAVGDNVASDYLMLKAGQIPQADFANSELQAIPGNPTCVNVSPGPSNFSSTYPLVQNDPAVSGVPSGPFSATTLGP